MGRKKPEFRTILGAPPPASSASSRTADASDHAVGPYRSVATAQQRMQIASAANLGPELSPALENEPDDLNPHLRERLHRTSIAGPSRSRPSVADCDNLAPYAIREYVAEANRHVTTESWLSRPEVPSTEEILDTEDSHSDSVAIPPNNIDGAWPSKERYLESHFELLREDTIRPLREAVGRVRTKPWAKESEYGNTVGVYSNVHIVGFTFSPRGLAARIQFSLARAGKRIHWEQSKRLLTGSLIALTPENDNFQSKCVLAVVAARPLANLVQEPPEIDIFFPRYAEAEIDPGQSWLVVEERTSYFEGTRHTLRALQKMMREPFPLSEHIISLNTTVQSPDYIEEHPHLDLSPIFEGEAHMNVLQPWPAQLESQLDSTQIRALQRMLTKKCAIVQGPPGTGKTHVSVIALKALLHNMDQGSDAPIIVACQTNHALDQLMRHVAAFEPSFARLGGRSRDTVVRTRSLYELKQSEKPPHLANGSIGPANSHLKKLERAMRTVLSPLEVGVSFMPHTLFRELGIITDKQFESLQRGDTRWETHGPKQQQEFEDPISTWIGKNFELVPRGIPPDGFAFEYEEIDLEFEQLKEIEAENMVKDDEDFETLWGRTINLSENVVGKHSTNMTEEEIRRLLSDTDNMYRIKDRMRGAVYNYLRSQVKQLLLESFRNLAKDYQAAVSQRAIGRWEIDHFILRKQKIIGMTTTGLSKYRALVSSLNPRIILIEEAAETLEAPVTAACVPSLEHLILVGDHRQLRPHCHVADYENEPFFLNVSLFERLVRNEVEFDTLRRQRRMVPEIRRLIKPVYGDLIKDHASVKDPAVRAPVPGMGDLSTFFFTHEWPESVDSQMSSCNSLEADMIVQFYTYLFMNGMTYSSITVLTFYNGQRKMILSKLRSHPDLQGTGRDFRVVTVDSYQGEENEVVLLSLVRSNVDGRIGFLNSANRVCVALSRAKRGFYMFGNGQLLASESRIWSEVITILAGKKLLGGKAMRIGYHLPLVCTRHGRKTFIAELDDWDLVNGGCEEMCKGELPCCHSCVLRCHPFPHETVNCSQSCQRILECGHVCAAPCADECRCTICVRADGAVLRPGARPVANTGLVARRQSGSAVGSDRLGPTPNLLRHADSVRPPGALKAHRKTESAGSDPSMWRAYTQNSSAHDARLIKEANKEYQKRLDQLNQRRTTQLEKEMERSVFDDRFDGGSSPALIPAARNYLPDTHGLTPPKTDGGVRQEWVHVYSTLPNDRNVESEPSFLD